MCYFCSFIITKNKEILKIKNSDDHSLIVEKFNLKDTTTDRAEMSFARVEITPPDGVPFYPLEKWKLKIDEQIKPEWFSPAHEALCWEFIRKQSPTWQKSFYRSEEHTSELQSH